MSRAPRALRCLASALLPALWVLAIAAFGHVHGISDPDDHHTPADFQLAFQTVHGIVLTTTLILTLGPSVVGRTHPAPGHTARPASVRLAASRAPPPPSVLSGV